MNFSPPYLKWFGFGKCPFSVGLHTFFATNQFLSKKKISHFEKKKISKKVLVGGFFEIKLLFSLQFSNKTHFFKFFKWNFVLHYSILDKNFCPFWKKKNKDYKNIFLLFFYLIFSTFYFFLLNPWTNCINSMNKIWNLDGTHIK